MRARDGSRHPTKTLTGRFSRDDGGRLSLPVVADGEGRLRYLVEAMDVARKDHADGVSLSEALHRVRTEPDARYEFGDEHFVVTVRGRFPRLGDRPVVDAFADFGDDMFWFVSPEEALSLLDALDRLGADPGDPHVAVDVFDVSVEEIEAWSDDEP